MMTTTVTGTVTSKSRKGNSIQVDGEWYGVYDSKDLDHVNWKDDVVLNYVMDKTGKYRNIKGKVQVSSSGGGSGGSAKGSNKNYTLGVELGHASKLAMDMAIAKNSFEGGYGSPEFYRFWVEHTKNIHQMMNKLKEEAENKPKKSEPEEEVLVYEAKKDVDESDIF